MSDEYQPNEVVDTLSDPEMMPAEPMEAESADIADASPVAVEASESASPDMDPNGDGAEAGAIIDVPSSEPVKSAAEDAGNGDHRETGAETKMLEPEPETEVEAPVPDAAGEAVPSTIVSLADLETPRRDRARPQEDEAEKEPGPAPQLLANVNALLAGRLWIVGAVVGVLLILFLFLPPISLAQRLGDIGGGYSTLDSETGFVEHPDGLRISRSAADDAKVRIKLASIPRADFIAGSVPDELDSAVSGLPAYLEPKSPYYTIDLKAKAPVAGTVTVVIPNEAEPWENLDLYAWDGKAWRWLPTQLDRDGEVLVSNIEALPASVIVLQSQQSMKRVVAETEVWPVEDFDLSVGEVTVAGLLIGTMGGTTGQADTLPPASAGGLSSVVPVIRNWLPGRDANWALVSDMLSLDTDRQAHTNNLVNLAQQGGYAGLVVDYRNVQLQDRGSYARFITELGAAFEAAGLWLGVVVETPQQAADGTWNTGGYDWTVLGAAADQVRVVMPLAPEVYGPGAHSEQLVQWAISQVERHKLMLVYSTLSHDGEHAVGLDTLLASVGEMRVTETLTESVLPGTQLTLSLDGAVAMKIDPSTGATQVNVGDQGYWVGTPQWLSTRMDLANRYLLGGVVLRDFFDARNLSGLGPVVAGYQSGDLALPSSDMSAIASLSSIVWTVTDPNGQVTEAKSDFSQPNFSWTAPEITGTYRLAVSVAGLDRGSRTISVSAPAAVVTDTVATEEAGEASTEEGEDEVVSTDTLKAGFVSDVTVPDNTRFEQDEEFDKTWRMKNAGDTDWPAGTVMAFVSGAELGTVEEVEVGAVEAGATVDIEVPMQAPAEDGTFRSVWELRVDGKAISGGGAYVQIIVGEEAAVPDTPDTPASPPPAPIPVASGAFELGGHIRDLGIPYADKMRYSGMNWVKIQAYYGQGADGAIAIAHSKGFKIQVSAIGGADMVGQPGFEDKFAAWVAGIAAAGADAIEVWNEPNIDREWKIGQISPQAYTNLLCKSYAAIKAANSGSAVISAAPAPTGWFGGCGPNGCDDKPWMEGLYNAGAANCMDYIGAHHNSGATSPSARIGHPANPGDPHHSWFYLPQTELYYNIFRGTRKIFYTEMGYASQEGVPNFSDGFGWARGITNAQQAAWLAEAVRLSISSGMVRCVIVWNIDFARYGDDPQDGFAILRPGGGCPACDTLHAVLGSR